MEQIPAAVNADDLKLLKERMKMIADADPNQYHNEFSLKRYLRAFKTVDHSFQVRFFFVCTIIAPYAMKTICYIFMYE